MAKPTEAIYGQYWVKMFEKHGYVYLLSNKHNTVIYTGVTSDLKKRIYEHKNKLADGFTKRYKVDKLVYFEAFENIETAIMREKQIKGGPRSKKIKLITGINPTYRDLYDEI